MIAAHPAPKDYAAALQVADRLGQDVKLAEARTRAAHDATFPATVAYLEALDAHQAYKGTRSARPASVQRDLDNAMRDLRECVARGQAEELRLEHAQAEHQKAARLAEALL